GGTQRRAGVRARGVPLRARQTEGGLGDADPLRLLGGGAGGLGEGGGRGGLPALPGGGCSRAAAPPSPALHPPARLRGAPGARPAVWVGGGAGVGARAAGRGGRWGDASPTAGRPAAPRALTAPPPGATASLAIGRHIAGLAAERFGLK